MQITKYLLATAGLLAVGQANECTLNTCNSGPCGVEACTETVGMQTLYFYYCCNDPGVEVPPGGSSGCPGCGGSKMKRAWSEIHALEAEDLERREAAALENRSPVEFHA